MTPADTHMTPAAAPPPPPPPPRPPRLSYRVTGAAAQARLVPLLRQMVEVDWYVFVLEPLPTAPIQPHALSATLLLSALRTSSPNTRAIRNNKFTPVHHLNPTPTIVNLLPHHHTMQTQTAPTLHPLSTLYGRRTYPATTSRSTTAPGY